MGFISQVSMSTWLIAAGDVVAVGLFDTEDQLSHRPMGVGH
jgi:hypothetical protein